MKRLFDLCLALFALLLSCCADALGVKARFLPVPQKLVEVCATIIGINDSVLFTSKCSPQV